MGHFSNKISREKLQLGDHIYRNGRTFSHHGIYVEVDRVIHFTTSKFELESGSESMTSKSEGKCDNCGHDPNASPAGVLKTCVDCFLNGHDELFLFQYGVSDEHFQFKTKGSCTTDACFEPDKTVKRASDKFTRGKGFGDYKLLENNSESFAAYCKRGRRVTEQGLDAIALAKAMAFEESIGGTSTSTSSGAVPSSTTSSVPCARPLSVFRQIASIVVPRVATYITSKVSSSSASR